MSTESVLLARARELKEDLPELRQMVTALIGGARADGLDPRAVQHLIGAAYALGTDGVIIYRAGTSKSRGDSGGFGSDGVFLDAVAECVQTVKDHLKLTDKTGDEAMAVMDFDLDEMDRAQEALAAAYAMGTDEPCNGCHGAKAAAIASAEAWIRDVTERLLLLEMTFEILEPLRQRLVQALERLRMVPATLAETYEAPYALVSGGGKLPDQARWLEGQNGR